ncbi:hypothetical protein WICPIJ_005748 [Wickerhamomyces pijperi]|uniref:Repressor of RNA polymerase III transcription MAF1 n=1 Tax=Wickerhamomyces pijperi TaxID=599730 RepID=A0A9P8Q5Q2_WICPI|nr:hypothetical protein WICPIJ_005748 [Wickerhamomyces pijperi]
MKVNETDIEVINQFLNFNTFDCHVSGGCDLFTTKPVGSDRKLFKTIEKQFDQIIENNTKEADLEKVNDDFANQKRRFSSTEPFYNKDTEELNQDENNSGSTGSEIFHKLRSKSIDFNASPFGPLDESTSRRTFSYLIGILNAMYPDNDYSSLEPQDFEKIQFAKFKSKFNNILLSLGKHLDELLNIWDNLNSHMDLLDCKIYQLNNLDSLEDSDYFNSNLEFDDQDDNYENFAKLWSYKWFCFNKKRKRVAFIHLDGYRLSSPKLYPVQDSKRRRLTIDNEFVEEYDLTYDSQDDKKNMNDLDESVFDDDDDENEAGYAPNNDYE